MQVCLNFLEESGIIIVLVPFQSSQVSFKIVIVEISKECSPKTTDEEQYGNSFDATNDRKPV